MRPTMLMFSFLHLVMQIIRAQTIYTEEVAEELTFARIPWKKKKLNRSTAIVRLMGFQ